MNELILKKYDENIIEYYYQPEGRGKQGVIEFDAKTGKAVIIEYADSDCDKQYDKMARMAVEQIAQKNNIPKRYTQAWY